jgi:RNA polymerase sigma-70 factor (ECF subfamily)
MEVEFRQLYEKYYSRVYYFLLKQVYNRKDLAEELTQETFYQAFLSLHRYRGDCDIVTWLFQIGKNTCFRYFKKHPILSDYDSEVLGNESLITNVRSMEQEYENKVNAEAVINCIKELKENYREVMLLRLQENLSFREIGEKLHISENSAKVLYFRGKEMIKKELEGEYYG